MCKKIAECLIEQRRHIEHLKQNNTLKTPSEQTNEKLEKIYILIEFLKKKINSSFEKNSKTVIEKTNSSLNMSISESLRNIEYFLRESEHKIDEDFEIIDANQVKEDISSEENDEEIKQNEAEAARQIQMENEQKRIEKEEAERKLLEEQKRIEDEKQRLRDELEKKELLKKEIEANLRREYEAKLKKEAEDLQLKNQNIVNSEQHEKVLNLIQTMRNQKWEHTRISLDILKEQFYFIQDQLKQINYEISQLSRFREKRLKSLSEFHEIVLSYDKLCDIKSFTAQFNVFYWLFQQQPSMGEFFLKQQNQQNSNLVANPLFKQPQVEVKQAQIQDESYTFTEDYECYEDEENEQDDNEEEEEEDEEPYVENEETQAYFTATKNRIDMFNSVPEFLAQDINNTNTSLNSNVEKRSSKNKDKSVSASTSMYHLNTMSNNVFLNKTIGDLKFPSGLDILGSMKISTSKYLLELSSEKKEEEEGDGEEEQENEYYEQESKETESLGNYVSLNNTNISSANFSQNTKDDTFVSCNEGNTLTSVNNSNNAANNTSKSSVNDLQLAFENNGNYFKYCDKSKSWVPHGKCNMQIIIDEMSVKGKDEILLLNNKK
jgi:hypothetical protein